MRGRKHRTRALSQQGWALDIHGSQLSAWSPTFSGTASSGPQARLRSPHTITPQPPISPPPRETEARARPPSQRGRRLGTPSLSQALHRHQTAESCLGDTCACTPNLQARQAWGGAGALAGAARPWGSPSSLPPLCPLLPLQRHQDPSRIPQGDVSGRETAWLGTTTAGYPANTSWHLGRAETTWGHRVQSCCQVPAPLSQHLCGQSREAGAVAGGRGAEGQHPLEEQAGAGGAGEPRTVGTAPRSLRLDPEAPQEPSAL